MTYLAKLTCHPGAVRWAAPELLSGEESTSVATTQSDMYSFGNIMLQVLTGNVPWCHLTRDFQISYQVVIEGKMHPRPNDAYVTDWYWDFMTRCWSTTYTDRPSAKEAVHFIGSAFHPSTSPQSPTLSISGDERAPSTSPQTPTLSISSGERHPGIACNDYLRGDTNAPYHAYFPDEDDNNSVIPPGDPLPQPVNYNNAIHHNWVNPNMQQNASLHYYMQHVLRIQYLHANRSIDNLIWKLVHSSDSAREAACLLADLHRKSTRGNAFSAPSDHDVYTRIQRSLATSVTGGDAYASLCMVSYVLFSGGQGQWQAFLDSACEFSIKVLQRNHFAPDSALISCSESIRFIVKASMWFDVLASSTLIRRPKFLELIRALYDPDIAVQDGRLELSMMGVMGCENCIVLALAEIADLACWKDDCRRAGRLSVPELVKRGQRIETILRSTNDPEDPSIDTETTHPRRLTFDVFRASALVYLYSVISGDDLKCPQIMSNITETFECLRRAEVLSPACHVVRSVVFSICICGCLTDVPRYRKYFLRRLQQQTDTMGNCARVAQHMKEVWSRRERGEPVDWRVVMQQSQMLLV
ncbi:hypothetical protein P692DRAFT_201433834 [Suillus brevipes Sb2]|nr:hypothetical protein P692DRAFT_201433834 [Suillus brevipes Sb2]